MAHVVSLSALLLISWLTPAVAQEDCSIAYDFDSSALHIGTIRSKIRKSPFEPGLGVGEGAYVVAGDEVVIGSQTAEFVCALYVNSQGETTQGWLKARDVTVTNIEPMPPEKWLGKWTAGEWHNIEIKKSTTPGWIDFVGEAAWANSAQAAKNGGLHEGGIGADVPIVDGIVGYTSNNLEFDKYFPYDAEAEKSGNCAARLKVLSRRYLMVEDNRLCGGANVSSSGFYVKRK